TSNIEVAFDSATRRVVAAERVRFRDLVVRATNVEPPAEAAARTLAAEVLAGRLELPHWNHAVDQWILRLNLLAQWCSDLQLPPIGDDDRVHLVEQICLGAASYKDLKDRPVQPVVQSWLSFSQRQTLDQHAPERLTLSNGRTPKLT